MNLFRSLTFITFFLFSSTTFSQGKVNVEKSSFGWKAFKKIGSNHHGTIQLKSHTIDFKDGKIKSAKLVIDMNSIDVTDLQGKWKSKFLNHMKNEDFFNVPKFPTSTIEFKEIGKHFVGNLTIMGKTHPVKIKFKKKKSTYRGKFSFDRTKYGVIYNSDNFFKNLAGDRIINNDVHINFSLFII